MNNSMVFALGGYSESGKSSSGRYMERLGYKRIKIADIYRRVYEESHSTVDFKDWSYWIDRVNPRWIGDRFYEKLVADLHASGHQNCTIESLYGDILASQLRRHLGEHFQVIFIDIDRDVRLQRQMHRENLNSVEEAALLLDPRDEQKRQWGADCVKEIADHVVDNSGTMADLEAQLDAIAKGKM